MLGPQMKYSCCWWDEGVRTLADAEQAALERTAIHAGVENGMRILELGCGWGSLSLWMARRFPCSRDRRRLELGGPARVHRARGRAAGVDRTSRSSPPT
jgi:ubiquinone/menaquinone biosynthesis C-methylase UbiE